ncbi:MAG: cupin domain-containing protein [Paracoccaceae bacterium]|nr:cupin domain-containing protein [Paracoccaceae bacterium]MDE2915064.1 cupin domain-containing protein [Paracoccaceae bacterium]
MNERNVPSAVAAEEIPWHAKRSSYPEPYASRMTLRARRSLGDFFGLKNFGVNLTTISPGGETALMHSHSKQDELVFVVQGKPTLVTESGETELEPGMCAGFRTGDEAHHVVNRTEQDAVILEIGDRTTGDEVRYPREDLCAVMGEDGKWRFAHKDGTPY